MSGPKSHDDPVFFDDSPSDRRPVTREGAMASPDAEVRPGGLTFICVLAIILSGAGLLMGCFGLVSQAFASGMQQAFAGMPGGANLPGADVQREMNARVMAVANRYKSVTLPLMVVKIFVEGALLAGAIMSWGLKPRGRSWLLGGLVAAILFEAIHVVPTILIQRETQVVMSEMMPKMMAAQQGPNAPPPGMNNLMSGMFSAIGILSLIFALVWLAAKVIFYVFGMRYLCKPDVRALFAPPAGDTFEAHA
jgi:hypothetical protein